MVRFVYGFISLEGFSCLRFFEWVRIAYVYVMRCAFNVVRYLEEFKGGER